MNSPLSVYTRFVRLRHEIYMKRQAGEPQPWTTDPILASKKFTNVFRVLDPGSQFVLTDLATDNISDFITRCVLYRMTNLPSTWKAVHAELGRYPTATDVLETDRLVSILQNYRSCGNTVFSGAYIIMPEPGTRNDKIEGAVRVTRNFVRDSLFDFVTAETQQERFNALQSTRGLGKFLSMQILTDWGYLQDVNRENEFIVAGPGARVGAKYVEPGVSPEQVIEMMTDVWAVSDVQINGHTPSLMDVQNTFCELSKHVRYMSRSPIIGRPYRPAHPGPQPEPVLPTWMR